MKPLCQCVKLRPGDCWELGRVNCKDPTDAILRAQLSSQDSGLAYAISVAGLVAFRDGIRVKTPHKPSWGKLERIG